ncbi:DUF2863 family protein [Noviherbaspirillum sp. Root189]|uniref:DUF2863 family protein n=1 Tax=Noviherbaspirillum sp. Root189 TaxID=1736487 RepID=UPI00070B47E8|nr:DUF2863 family protein [Noviherbaspirillum sp. Root189]KRB84520.1 hypothetical protein ASE07_03730 [Noviherbaspirillum sp. Root189]
MRRLSKSSANKLSADSQRLVSLAQGVAQSASRLEERNWEHSLDALLHKILKANHQEHVDAALEHLFKADLPAYDTLMEAVEAGSESCFIEHEGVHYEALLIAIPVLAWTRFSIASGPVPDEVRNALCAHLHGHLLAPDAHVAMAPTLFSIDQLPRTHAETFALTQRMAQAAVKAASLKAQANAPETAPFLADTRYLLAAVAVRMGSPMFAWQASAHPADREKALEQWRRQATPNIAPLLPGCGIELLMPEAYYVACREADRQIRPASIRAAVHFLTHTLGVETTALRAIIGSFSEEPGSGRVDEYRVAFTLRQSPEVVYGVVWPLYGAEDEDESAVTTFESITSPEILDTEVRTPVEQIIALLRACGVTHIKRHSEEFPMDFCDDCGAPLYPDAEAELVHAELPDDAPASNGHLH